MAKVTANGIQIEYETFGNPSARPLLLIIGLGGQMIQWDDDLCKNLVERGHYVIRYDNRDAGLSSKFEAAGVPNLIEIFGKIMQGQKIQVPYTLDDMADDGVGLLDALGIRKAHICGMSMGGNDRPDDRDPTSFACPEFDLHILNHRQSGTSSTEAGGDGTTYHPAPRRAGGEYRAHAQSL
jgi:hypothetical protein